MKRSSVHLVPVPLAACGFGVLLVLMGTLGAVGSVSAALTTEDDLPPQTFLGKFHRRAETGGLPFALSALSTLAAGVVLTMAAC